jgi:hypothetical protein
VVCIVTMHGPPAPISWHILARPRVSSYLQRSSPVLESKSGARAHGGRLVAGAPKTLRASVAADYDTTELLRTLHKTVLAKPEEGQEGSAAAAAATAAAACMLQHVVPGLSVGRG